MSFVGEILYKNNNFEKEIFSDKLFKNKIIKIKYTENSKFKNDNLFFKVNNKLFLIEGVILNIFELKKEYKINNWKDLFYELYKEYSLYFLNKLRGNFRGLIYDIEKNEVFLFTDQLKTQNIFYKENEDKIIFSTDLLEIISLKKEENILDESAAYLLLTFGGTLTEKTLFRNIKKLNYGMYLKIDNAKKIHRERYYKLENIEDITITEEKAIEEIDRLFRNAIKREYEKDKEYGYSHFVNLSAGRDSRMNTWVANELGYKENVLNATFSETNELDEIIPKEIARELKHEWIFKSLDNGNCLYSIDDVISKSYGEVQYGTLAHSYSMNKYLKLDKFGLIHTGMLGDVVLSTFGSKNIVSNENLDNIKYVYSKKLFLKVIEKKIIENFYQNEEIFNYVYRGISVTNESSVLFSETYVVSPFTDIDFLDYALKIPCRIREGNNLYDKWILKKYPEAAKYTHNGRKIGEREINIFNRKIPISEIIPRILKKLKILKKEKGMNPFDYWYNNNNKLKDLFDEYYRKNILRLSKYKELQDDCKILYEEGNMSEKCQVITLLSVLKLFF